jgi:hypothetical protein
MSIPLLIVVAAQIITTASGRQYRNDIDPVGNASVRLPAQYAFCDPLLQESSPCPTYRARAFAKLELANATYSGSKNGMAPEEPHGSAPEPISAFSVPDSDSYCQSTQFLASAQLDKLDQEITLGSNPHN